MQSRPVIKGQLTAKKMPNSAAHAHQGRKAADLFCCPISLKFPYRYGADPI
jgi:hypothetical protein